MADFKIESFLKCIRCGEKIPLYGTVIFTCRKEVEKSKFCDGLYDVVHDGLEKIDHNYLRMLFDSRTRQKVGDVTTMSGVWRFRELVMGSLRKSEIVSLGEGIHPFWEAGRNLRDWIGGGLDLWILPEGLGPTGAFKDNGMTAMVSVAKKNGMKVVTCSSTGDTSASLAAYGAAAGVEVVVFLPADGNLTSVQLMQPAIHGAKIVLLPGKFDEAMNAVLELAEQGRVFPGNSINPTRIEGHQATVFLTAQFFGWELPDWFVVPVGNGSNTSSVGKGVRLLKELRMVDNTKDVRILGAQAAAASPLARSWRKVKEDGHVLFHRWKQAYQPGTSTGITAASAMDIDRPVSHEKVMREICASKGAMVIGPEEDMFEALRMAGRDGYALCPQTGIALAGLRLAVQEKRVKPRSRVVVVSTATGLKFPDVLAKAGHDPKRIHRARSASVEEIADILGV